MTAPHFGLPMGCSICRELRIQPPPACLPWGSPAPSGLYCPFRPGAARAGRGPCELYLRPESPVLVTARRRAQRARATQDWSWAWTVFAHKLIVLA